ncbi:replication initiator protein A [Lactiplantibacillus plantarum]|uniref:replication initiator protein A n=1 Tax=Lactiplantibacillus plantarum TaxID=1590 RepID=UPI0007AB5A8A|nr:replication initiator protein A [Lactiplantibacillus plantarum]KZE02038.1 Electron transfer flavoprotein-ubiquinone oxidoreductase [Lactiplantibacillus plantarum]
MDQSNFNFTNAKRAYEVKFYALPQILLQGEKYKDLSDSAILLYSVLRDRLSYSLSNNWVDENNNVYFIYTNNELKDLRNWSNNKINKIKHELMDANLLYQKHMGFNPRSGKNEPNRLYLADLEVTAKDVYIKREPLKSPEPLGTSGLLKKRNPHDTVSDTSEPLGTSGLLKKRQDLDYTNNLDTNRYNIDTQKLDFSTANFSPAEIQKQNQDLVNHANDFLTDEDSGLPVFLEPEAVQLLSFWCRTPQQMRRFIGIILNAKYRVEKDHKDIGVIILLGDEELRPLMTKALRRYFNALRSNEKHIKNVENYLYGTMQNLFGVWWNKQAAREYAAKHPEEEKSADNDNSGLYY